MASPKLRFKEFDGDWIKVDIQTLVDEKILDKPMDGNHGEIHPVSADYVENGIPFVMATDVIDGKVHLEKSKKIRKSQADSLRKGFSLEGDILLTHKATIGNVAKVPELETPYVMLTPQVTYYRVLNKEKLDPDFIKSTFEAPIFQNELLALCTGATRLYIGISEQRKLPFSYPSKEEQTKIASFLSAVDEKIAQLTQKHELLSQYKQGMMQKLFSQQIRFKADDWSEFGEWEKLKFADSFNFYQTNSYSRALLSEVGEIMNIHYGDIHTKFSTLFDVSKEVVPFINGEVDTSKISSEQYLRVGDLVIADASEDYKDIGKTIEVIHLDNSKVVAGLHTYIARPIKQCAMGFNGYLMQTFEVREQIKTLATGISVLGISKTNLGKVELKIPCLEEQTKIANFLFAIDQKIEKVAQQIEETKQWKKGLLQQMFV